MKRTLLTLLLVMPQGAPGDDLRPGLVATYRDSSHSVRLAVPAPSFYLAANESVHPALAAAFEAEWNGLVSVLETGDYLFECAGEVTVDGREARGKAVALSPGRHPIRIRYRRPQGPAQLELRWRSTKFAPEPVPPQMLFHRASDAPAEEEARVERGRRLVEELGCVNCHAAGGSLAKRFGPHLTGLGSRTHERWLYGWLTDAAAYRPDAVMPAMLEDSERRDVARYLASLEERQRFAARRTSAADVEAGKKLFGAVGCAACHLQRELPLSGTGSKTSVGALAAYLREPSRFDPAGRMPSMLLTEVEAIQLAAYLVESRNPAFDKPVEGGDPARGREIVRARGCLACHALEDRAPVSNALGAPDLGALDAGRGCLAEEPRGVPRYRLSAEDRTALRAFVASYRRHPDRSAAPIYAFRRTIERLRCAACHAIDHQAPTGNPAEAAPPLTDTGAKLRTRWIAEVLTGGKRVQGWLELRMPHYDPRVARPLADGFARGAGLQPGDGPAPPATTEAERTRGIELIGMNVKKGGMACIGCHDWGDFKSQGEHGPDLVGVAERLRYDWYARWMRDPTRILSGTSMPSYFRNKKPEDADAVIRTLWGALVGSDSGPLPEGLKAPSGVLGSEEKPVAALEPIVVRWDMPEATPAAIAVGLPGRVSYCFDAGDVRLRYAWIGGFVDLSGTLYRKVDESRLTPTAKLVGEVFYRAEEFPLRIGSPERVPERRFRGYRLAAGHPEFHYLVDGVDVYERIVAAQGNRGIVRELRIARVDGPAWFLIGPAPGLAVSSSLGAPRAGRLELPRGSDVRFTVTLVRQESRQ